MKSKMVIKNIWKYLSLFIMILFFSSFVNSAVEIFSNYDTQIDMYSNNSMNVHKSMTLQNVHIVGIVPGRVEFKIGNSNDDSVSKIDVSNIIAFDKNGRKIRTQKFVTKDGTTIALDIFTPILPGFQYKIDLYYTLSYDSSGVFFKNMEIPVKEETSIPIKKGSFKVTLPNNYYFTFISNEQNDTIVDGNSAVWNFDDNSPSSIRIEYSYIPLKLGGVKGSYLFWLAINIILLIILSFEIKKQVKKYKK